jgi:hypothetical protein
MGKGVRCFGSADELHVHSSVLPRGGDEALF